MRRARATMRSMEESATGLFWRGQQTDWMRSNPNALPLMWRKARITSLEELSFAQADLRANRRTPLERYKRTSSTPGPYYKSGHCGGSLRKSFQVKSADSEGKGEASIFFSTHRLLVISRQGYWSRLEWCLRPKVAAKLYILEEIIMSVET